MLTKHGDFKVLRVFFEYPERKIHIREIARLTKLSPPGVLKIVRNLTKEGMLVLEKGKVVKNLCERRRHIKKRYRHSGYYRKKYVFGYEKI